MAFGMLQSAAAPIAVEFGVASLKALQLEPGEPPSLIAAACLETPEELRDEHEARLTHQCERVGALLKRGGFKGRRVICSIPAPFTLVQHLQLGKAEGVGLTDQISTHLLTKLNCDPTRLVVRHIEVGDVPSSSGARVEVICFAVARDMVMRIMSALRSARYEVIGMHSEHVALTRGFDRVTKRASDRDYTSMYLDLGAGATKIVLARGRQMMFAKTINVSGRDFDAVVARALRCDPAEARARRLAMGRDIPRVAEPTRVAVAKAERVGIADPGSAGKPVLTEDRRVDAPTPGLTGPMRAETPVDDADSMNEPIESLAAEVSMCLRYHERQFGDRPVGRCIFVGGEARNLTLCQRLAHRLRLPAQIADPMACVHKSGKEPTPGVDFNTAQPGWAVAFGLSYAPHNL